MARLFASLRIRLILLVLFAILPAVVLTLYTASQDRQRETKEAQSEALRLAQVISIQEEELITATRQLLVGISHSSDVRSGDPALCSAFLTHLLEDHFQRYANLGIIKPNGDIFCSAVPISGTVNVTDRKYFQRSVQTRDFAMGEYQIGRVTGKPSVNFGYPVVDDNGQVQGVVFAALDVERLNVLEHQVESKLPSDSTLTKIDRNGLVLVHYPDPEKWVGQPFPNTSLVKNILTQHQGVFETFGPDNLPRVYAFTPVRSAIQDEDVYVILELPQATVFAEVDSLLARNLIVLGISAVLALAAAWIGGDVLILRRTQALVRATERLAAGNLRARTGLHYGIGELSQLARTFDDMAESLEQREAERRRAVQALRQSEELYRTLAEAAHDMIFVVSQENLVQYVNSFAAKQFGRQPHEVIGKHLEELFPANISVQQESNLRRVFETGEPLYVENKTPLVDQKVWLGTWLVPLKNGLGDTPTILGISRDITARKEIEQTLRESQERLELLYRLSLNLSESLDIHDVAQRALDTICSAVGSQRGTVLIHEPGSAHLRVVTASGYGTDSIETLNRQRSLLPHDGLAGWVAAHRQSALVDDVRKDERWEVVVPSLGDWVRSVLSVPLITRDELVGVIVTSSDQEAFFTVEHLQLAQSAAATLAAAMTNARLYAEARQYAFEIETLNQVGQKLAATLNMEDIVELVGKEAGNLLRPGNLSVYLYDETHDEVEKRFYLDRGERKPGSQFPLGEGLVSYIIRQKEAILASDYLSECAKRGIPPRGDPAKAWLGVPIITDEQVLGALIVWDYEREGSLNERDLRVLSTLASQAAIAIKNARLHGELQSALGVQSKLFDASVTITSQSDVDAVLQTIVESAREAVTADRCSVMLIDAQGYCYRWLGVGHRVPLEPHAVRPEGLSLRVMRSRQAMFIADVASTPDVTPRIREEGIRSSACLPLWGKTGQLGVMWVHLMTPHVFSPAEQTTLQTFANYAAAAVEQVRLFEETRYRLANLEAVNKISTALRVAQTFDEMLPILLDETLGVLKTNAGTIWLYDPVGNALRQTVNRRLPEVSLAIKPGEGLAGQVFATGQPYVSHEFKSDPGGTPSIRAQVAAGLGGAVIPIRTADRIVGVLFVAVELPRELTPDEVRLLSTLAEMAGNAIHRMQLHEQTVQHVQRLSALHAIDIAISNSLDLRITLGILLDQVMAQLHIDAASILLLNRRTQMLEYAAGRGFRSRIFEKTRLRLGEGHAGRAALERRIIAIPDLREDPGTMARSQWLAGEGFITYHSVPLIAKGQIKGMLETFHRFALDPDPEWLGFLHALGLQAAIAIDNAELFESLQRSNAELVLAYETTLEGWSRALDLRDKETEGHTQRVTEITVRLAQAMEIGESELVHVRRGALLHDIGKMGIPDGILLKPDKLTEDEWEIMRRHPVYAYKLLSPILYLRPALDIPYCHHEKWDGTGYPRGLKGEEIPLAARLFAVADVWDALRSDRPYRKGWSEEKVRDYIREQSGSHFDPRIVEIFLNLEWKD